MSRYWSELVHDLTPYVPGEQPQHDKLVKLNTNENPYGPSPAVATAIAKAVEDLQLYPDPESTTLRAALARLYPEVSASEVFLGNGSDEVLAIAFQALFCHGRPVYGVDISYSFYPVWSQLYGIDWQSVPLKGDFSVDVSTFPAHNGGIVLPNPNAPTGIALSLSDIESLLQTHPDSVVLIDEAYIDFGGESAVPLIKQYDNLLVVQTFSKSRSLAGLRVGMAFGSESLIEALTRVKNSFNSYPLDRLTQAGAVAALADQSWFEQCCNAVVKERDNLTRQLQDLDFQVLPSAANFVLASHGSVPAKTLFEELRKEGVIVRYFSAPRIDNYLRITVGTPNQCERLLAVLRQLLAGRAAD